VCCHRQHGLRESKHADCNAQKIVEDPKSCLKSNRRERSGRGGYGTDLACADVNCDYLSLCVCVHTVSFAGLADFFVLRRNQQRKSQTPEFFPIFATSRLATTHSSNAAIVQTADTNSERQCTLLYRRLESGEHCAVCRWEYAARRFQSFPAEFAQAGDP
jgi:hypothetical protein